MVGLSEIQEARRRIAGQVLETPCAPSGVLGELFGGRAWLKFENLQRTGSFKERGALNRLLDLSDEERARGVIAASAGNHAQGVAYHASRLGVPATIVMPSRTPLIKVANTERFGARVVLHGEVYDAAMAEALRLKEEHGLTLVHPFDDDLVIAGQGTIGLELLEQVTEMQVLVVPIGGGGLIAGIAAAVKAVRPEVWIVGVEAASLPAALRARAEGEPVTIEAADTIAEGIAVKRIGERTFPMIERYVDEIVTVTEDEIANAILLLLEREKTVAEGAGAAAVAAVVQGKVANVAGKSVAMLLSGGNIDVNLLSRIIDRGLMKDGRLAEVRVRVKDRPGALARLTGLVAEGGANILELAHRRGMVDAGLTEAEITLLLELRGHEHAEAIRVLLRREGFTVLSAG